MDGGSLGSITPSGGIPDLEAQQRAQAAAQQAAEQARVQKLLMEGKNADGSAIRPEFVSLIDPSTGLLKSQYQTEWGTNITPDMRGIEALRERALSTGPSTWQNLALQRQALEEQGLKDSSQQQGASAAAQARSSLASHYGLSPAAQERLAVQNQRNQMQSLQNVGFQGAKARSDLALQDEQMRTQMLQALPGQENALAQVALQNRAGDIGIKEWNIQNALAEKRAKDQSDMNTYHEQMSAWAAQKQAEAMRNAGGGGGKK